LGSKPIEASLGGQVLAYAVRSVHRCRVEQHERCNGQYLEEHAHEGEVKVYSSQGCLQQIGLDNAGGG
jgi:hypothetical protein